MRLRVEVLSTSRRPTSRWRTRYKSDAEFLRPYPEQWHSNFRGQAYVDGVLGYVDLALEGLQSGARVLDLGCGTGNLIAKYIIEKGFRVIGVDQSEKMLEIAKKEVPEAEFIHAI